MQPLHQRKKRKKIILYIIIIIAFIVINPFNMFDAVRSVIMVPLTPLNARGFNMGSYISQRAEIFFNIGTLYKQNQELQNKVGQLESQNAYLNDVKNENTTLRESMKLLPREEFELLGAEIISRNPTGGNQWIVINRGSRDGLEVDDVVIVGDKILIGHIDEVDYSTARVQLTTNPASVVNVVATRSSAEAIAYGNHGLSITVEDIEKDVDVAEGEIFITSDVGEKYPRGLSVGKVQNVTPSQDNLFQTANLLPLVDFDNQKFVFIIK